MKSKKGRDEKEVRRVDPVKTTVFLPRDLWRAAKVRAMDEEGGLRGVVIRALGRYLNMKVE